jgi:nucleoside-diphosphate-sugar epimerase
VLNAARPIAGVGVAAGRVMGPFEVHATVSASTLSPHAGSSVPSGGRRTAAILVTGAGGEMGHGLLGRLAAIAGRNGQQIVAVDVRELDESSRHHVHQTFVGDICDRSLLDRLQSQYEIHEIFHLAALLSTRGEFVPETAHAVNVVGTVNLLRLAAEEARANGRRVKFVFPSSIAVYGLPDLATKRAAGAITEEQFLEPHTMYGVNKLEGEHLGRYYARHYRTLAKDRVDRPIDFRSIRFPGIISADTVPSGGTSDYGPEMIHAGAAGKPYACFVRPDARIPFMTMPEAIDAILKLAAAREESLTRMVYNVSAFSPSAEEFAELVRRAFPQCQISFNPDLARQSIVDSWPEGLVDRAARADWGWAPTHTLQSAFDQYLVPKIRSRYV